MKGPDPVPPVSVLIKPASGLCDLRCDYCFYCDEASKRRRASYGLMAADTLTNVIRKCVIPAEGSCSIAFQGGDPTLCGLSFFEKAVEYAAHFNRNGIRIDFALQTNGYGLTEEWCRFFADNHFLVGVSVDGTRAIHDRCRRSRQNGPTYDRVIHSIGLLKKHRAEFNILTVVHREVAENIREIYQAYRQQGWNYLQFITCLDPLNEPRGKQPYSLLPEAYGRFLIELFDLWYADYRRGNAPFIRQFENYIGICLGLAPESCEQVGVCGIQFVAEADGSVYPCDFYALDEWKLGNFNQDRLAQLNERRAALGFCARSRNHPPECLDCKWLSLCRGGCFRSRLAAGEPEAGRNYFCSGYRMFFDRWGGTLADIANKIRLQGTGSIPRPPA